MFERLFSVIITAEIHKMSYDNDLTCKQHTFNGCESYHYQVCKISSRFTYWLRSMSRKENIELSRRMFHAFIA